MNTNDLVTAGFECGAAWFCWSNVFALLRDKQVKGTSYGAPAFFSLLGSWQVWVFANQIGPVSSICAAAVAAANFTWLGLAIRFKLKALEDLAA